MKRYENKAENVRIAYIGGGSRGWAWGLMSDLAAQDVLSGTVYLYDINTEAAYANEIIGNSVNSAEGVKSVWKYKTAPTLKDALTGADFVVISILPGTFDDMESDVHAPEKYGIYQSVGDTAGPGGMVRAMRTLPMYVPIAEAIKEYAPDAWVINYTNPMTLCCAALYKIFPQIKAFGCCHEVFSTQMLLCTALDDILGIKDVKRSDICINVHGINHFTWISDAWYRDINLMEVYKKFADKYFVSGYVKDESDHWMNNSFACANRVKFDLFKMYGEIAAAGDRHLAEFMPGHRYLESPERVREWMFGLTTVAWRKDDLKKRLERSARLVSGEEKFQLKRTGEEGVHMMQALAGYGTLVSNVNLPNVGQMRDVPLGEVVETNAVFRHNTVTPVTAQPMKTGVAAMVNRHAANHELVLHAAFTRDFETLLTAFVNDPLVTCSYSDARALLKEMLDNTNQKMGD